MAYENAGIMNTSPLVLFVWIDILASLLCWYNMALNTNYGFPPSGYSSPYSSTPTGIRTQRPRFGYSGPSLYSSSRASGSDINTDSFSDSMINNYGTSTSRIDTTLNSESRSSFNNTYNTSGSNYYSANESFSHSQSYERIDKNLSLRCEGGGFLKDNSMMYKNQNMIGGYSGTRPLPRSDIPYSTSLPKPPIYPSLCEVSKYNYNSTFGLNNVREFTGKFQKNLTFGDKSNKPYFVRKQGNPLKMATEKSGWSCEICSVNFTSKVPYNMHIIGSKHAKKIKTQQALTAVELQADSKTITSQDDKKTFFCELCNIKANSSLQLRTHLDGAKHKLKLQPKEVAPQPTEITSQPTEITSQPTEVSSEPQSQENSKVNVHTSVNGKTNESLVRSRPSDFGEPRPSKLAKFACEVCNVAVNSEIQLQQHLSSKKHQNKVEGKPISKGKKVKKNDDITPETTDAANERTEDTSTETASNESSAKVIGLKTLASSFVLGETLQ